MSHGGGGEGEACEPNMTPLLDLVLQILMFFIVTVNFVTAEDAGNVALPESQSARVLSEIPSAKDPIFLNLLYDENTSKHEIVLPLQLDSNGKSLDPMDQLGARSYMKKLYEDLSRGVSGPVPNPVIIRAHKSAEYNQVFQVLQSCSDAGFRQLKVRAMKP
jgi:biopolymer transport protein ExbD